MNPDIISQDLKSVLRRLKLGRLLDVLPERLTLARSQQIPHQDFLLTVLSDEAQRRDGQSAILRAQRAHLDADMRLEAWDNDAKVSYDRTMLNELVSMRFVEAHSHVAIVGPFGVGKTFLAHALGHIACRHGYTVHATRADQMLRTLRHARLDNTHDAEMRKLLAIDLLIVDDFALDAMDAQESRDAYEILYERHRAGSMIVTSNRGPDEWLAMFADPVRAQSAIDRFCGNSYDLVVDGQSYRPKQKPKLEANTETKEETAKTPRKKSRRRRGSR